MATKIMPERFSAGDFTAWLRQFERCAVANAWDTDTRDFGLEALRLSEDPSLYLWRLKDLLRNAEPVLGDEAFDALL